MKKSHLFVSIFVILIIIGIIISLQSSDNRSETTSNNLPTKSDTSTQSKDSDSQNPGSIPEWIKTELTDVNSGEKFTIEQFKGKPILLESFAVWCPSCTKQQNKIKELHEEIGDDVISISMNTATDEDSEQVRKHALANGFDWRYVISPKEVTQALIDEFGVTIVSAPSVPVVLICEDLSTRRLGGGVKSVEVLKSEIAQGCN